MQHSIAYLRSAESRGNIDTRVQKSSMPLGHMMMAYALLACIEDSACRVPIQGEVLHRKHVKTMAVDTVQS